MSGLIPTRKQKKRENEWACTHSKQQKKLKRVGLYPLEITKKAQTSGPIPTQNNKKAQSSGSAPTQKDKKT